jgi:hypothetical protein
MSFVGLKITLEDKYRLTIVPSLFRTELRPKGNEKGFKRSFNSRWFAFLEVENNRWLKADKNEGVTSLKDQ